MHPVAVVAEWTGRTSLLQIVVAEVEDSDRTNLLQIVVVEVEDSDRTNHRQVAVEMTGQTDSQKAAVAEKVGRINLPKAAVAARTGQINPQKAAAAAAKAGRIDPQSAVGVAAAGKVVQTGLRLRLPVEDFADSAQTIRRPMVVVGLALGVVHFRVQRLRLKAAVAVEAVDSQRWNRLLV